MEVPKPVFLAPDNIVTMIFFPFILLPNVTKGLAQRKSSESSSLVISLEASLVALVSAEATGFVLTWQSYLCPHMGSTQSL